MLLVHSAGVPALVKEVPEAHAPGGEARAHAVHVVALIPAYNEAGHIAAVVERTLALVDEVVVVDDGSTDGTGRAAAEAGATVVDNIVNRGLGPTMRRGYQEALARNADIIVQLDADGQYDAASIPALVGPIVHREADMVLGARLDDIRYEMPRTKRWGNEAFSWVLRKLTGQDVRDGQTGFRAMRREVLESCLPINKFSYTQEMILRASAEGWRIRSVPVEFHPRYDGQSRLFSSPLRFAVRQWTIILRTMRDYYPMKFFGIPGALLLLVGLGSLAVTAAHYLETGYVSGRVGTAILGVLGTVAGFQLVALGLLADMIRTHRRF